MVVWVSFGEGFHPFYYLSIKQSTETFNIVISGNPGCFLNSGSNQVATSIEIATRILILSLVCIVQSSTMYKLLCLLLLERSTVSPVRVRRTCIFASKGTGIREGTTNFSGEPTSNKGDGLRHGIVITLFYLLHASNLQ